MTAIGFLALLVWMIWCEWKLLKLEEAANDGE